jgi:YD repeat-containing protein
MPIASVTYDLLGNRSSLTDRFGLHQYGYDALSRLTSVDHPLASPLPDERFTYDPVGNRRTSHFSAQHQHDTANRLLEDAQFTYTYDANGNRATKRDKTTMALTSYTYNVENQLIGVDLPDGGHIGYRYDGLGRRIEKNVNGTLTRYLYDQEDIVTILDGADCGTQVFLHGPGIDQPLGFLQDTNANCDPFNDGAGFREPIVDLLTV